jgi:bifunctional DNase/RNase
MAVEMELHKIMIIDGQDIQRITLKESEGERTFDITIGSNEASAIDRRLKGHVAPRPQTHDLMASLIEALGGQIERIEITNLSNGTFFAVLHVRAGGRVVQIDCRPSDAIALGAAASTPIFVAEHVLDAVC